MPENIEQMMKEAKEALEEKTPKECIDLCNTVLEIRPDYANAKVLKATAILYSYSLYTALSSKNESLDIIKSITNSTSITDEYKLLYSEAVFAFRNCWEKDNTTWAWFSYFKGSKESDDDDEFSLLDIIFGIIKFIFYIFLFFSSLRAKKVDKESNSLFMDQISRIDWLQSYPPFLNLAIENINHKKIKDISFTKILINANKGKTGIIEEMVKKLELISNENI